jgi:stage V sporulation protein G
MPSRKIKESCPKCNHKNVVRSKFCNECGERLPVSTQSASPAPETEHDLRQSEHKDIAHPITVQAREYIQKKIMDAYQIEKNKI